MNNANIIFKHGDSALWVGNKYAAQDRNFLIQNNIRVIINATPDVPNYYQNSLVYMRVPVHDKLRHTDIELMYAYLPQTVLFARIMLMLGYNVLVHCVAGMQRSAIIAAAILCSYNIQPASAIALVIQARPIAFMMGYSVNFSPSLFAYCSKKLHNS
jgi:protein-tyrosine phosphatase